MSVAVWTAFTKLLRAENNSQDMLTSVSSEMRKLHTPLSKRGLDTLGKKFFENDKNRHVMRYVECELRVHSLTH